MNARTAGAAGLLAGVAVGIARRRALLRRDRRDRRDREELGGHTGRPVTVTTGDGVRLAVDVEQPEAPSYAVVFAHGWVLNRHSWHFQREALTGRAMLVFYDQRGHGASSPGAYDCCTIEQLGDDLHAVIEAVVPPGLPVVVVGHSMGGMTVMGLAARHPDLFGRRIVGAALLSTSSGRLAESTFGLPGAIGRLAPRVTPLVFDRLLARADLIDRSAAVKTRTNWPVTRYIAFGARASREHVRFVNGMAVATPTSVMVGFFHGMAVHDKLDALKALGSVPTLVMVGAQDRMTPPVHSRRIAEALPHARLVVIPTAGHMIGLERPDVVNRALGDFLDDLEGKDLEGRGP